MTVSIWIVLGGAIAGVMATWGFFKWKIHSLHALSLSILQQAQHDADQLKLHSQLEQETRLHEHQQQLQQQHQNALAKLQQKQSQLEQQLSLTHQQRAALEKKDTLLQKEQKQVTELASTLQSQQELLTKKLESLAHLTTDDARTEILSQLKQELQTESAHLIAQARSATSTHIQELTTELLSKALQRLSLPTISPTVTTALPLPNEQMKARIIGREGRNIQFLEKLTGTTFTIDDDRNAVLLSAFDPFRKYIAQTTLSALIEDGRIHPTRIEEAFEMASQQASEQLMKWGRDAALKVQISDFHPEILRLLGLMNLRTSFGQNLLEHSLEVAFLMGLLADEMHLDRTLAVRIGLLHDIGKAVSHEVKGSHAVVGHDLALKYGEKPTVANGIGCHHDEMEPTTIEASLCQTADALSGSRPGARQEAAENALQRAERMEAIARAMPGVSRAFAVQAGREIRVVVDADALDDEATQVLARDLAKKLEKERIHPGKVRVSVSRETKVVDYAL